MAITVNGAVLRNMPEQISKNVEDIADLQTTSENHGTRITALENDAIALATFQDCVFTGTSEFQGNINQTSGNLAIQNNASINGSATVGGAFNANGSSYLHATSVTGALTASGTVTASNDLDVGGDLSVAVDASVAGDLAVTGAVTGGSIIENMSGYSFSKTSIDSTRILEYKYAGVCKNGNKLTFAIGLNITRIDDLGTFRNNINLGTFTIPSSISALLIPSYADGSFGSVLFPVTITIATTSTSFSTVQGLICKSGNDVIAIALGCDSLTLSTAYYFRVEATFLLSDNLAA